MVQVHVPQGVGVRVPPWAPKHKRSVDESQPAFCVLGHTSKAPARLAGGTRKIGLARPIGVAVRDRVPPWAPKHKRSVDESQPAFCVLGHTSKAPARLAGGTRKIGLARPIGVAVRDRVPPWAPKHKRSVDESQPAFCVLGHTSKAPARLAGGTRKIGLAR